MPSRLRASRRAVLGGAAGGVALLATGCGTQDGSPAEAGAEETTAPAVDADSELVTDVVGHISAALALATATAKAVPALRPLGKQLAALHRSHLDELGQSGEGDAGRVKGTADAARVRLLHSEEQLQQRLVRAAIAAESGALAQVFAAMAAAIAQQRAVAA